MAVAAPNPVFQSSEFDGFDGSSENAASEGRDTRVADAAHDEPIPADQSDSVGRDHQTLADLENADVFVKASITDEIVEGLEQQVASLLDLRATTTATHTHFSSTQRYYQFT